MGDIAFFDGFLVDFFVVRLAGFFVVFLAGGTGVAIAIVFVAVGVLRRRKLAVPDALDDMRRRLDKARDIARIGEASPSAANEMLNVCRFGLHQVEVLRDWGEEWLDAQDATIKCEVDAAEREFKAYRRQALGARARSLPQDLPGL